MSTPATPAENGTQLENSIIPAELQFLRYPHPGGSPGCTGGTEPRSPESTIGRPGIREAGFSNVECLRDMATPLGTISILQGSK